MASTLSLYVFQGSPNKASTRTINASLRFRAFCKAICADGVGDPITVVR